MMYRDHANTGGRRRTKGGRASTIDRLVKEEAGMTMGLVVIMIVLIGVMGAGLLTFVSTDLNTVVEVNQGQRAFEMADAGIKAAKKQLRDKDSNPKHYGGSDGNTGDIQWAKSKGGMNLDMTDSTDRVNVKIESDTPSSAYYTVTSTGGAGDAARKVEAVLLHTASLGRGGIPAWYTPGGMRVKKSALVKGVSLFAGGDIVIRKDSGSGAGEDVLGDWNRPPYNTTARKDPSTGGAYTKAGLAAEGRVLCSATDTGAGSVCGSADTEGLLYYDSTTATKFVETPTSQPQPANEITYPFPREVNIDALLEEAKSGSPNLYLTSAGSVIPESTEMRVVFVDANGGTVDFDKGSEFNGVLVVRCGNLNLDKEGTFNGIIIAMKGEGAGCGSTGKVNFKKLLTMNGTVYAESLDARAIDDDKGANVGPLPDGYDDFSRLSFISSVELVSWRELYQ